MSSHNDSTLIFHLIANLKKVNVDYTPQWGRGNPRSYVDNVTFPHVLTDKAYKYRVVKGGWGGGQDMGVRNSYAVQSDGSQKINFLEYNSGHGIEDTHTIQVYVVDPDNGNQYLIAQWN
ncbi:immunomodulatory [Fusarium albosuccineum]|uniref:Immunomodulatory n=1 Tax=Fusarium albosuccineum TaxID=1237068 RepID=A0A8H4P4P6_9HYPO|nr:immunomodulatory [Fusarium albosuccineum]